MKQGTLTEEQQAILDEIAELVKVGEQKLEQFAEESTKMDAKWRKRLQSKTMVATPYQNYP
jgi:hypothetical protein